MHLTFALEGDGPVFPDFPGEDEAAVDSAVVGPLGLLSILETRLGLGGPAIASSVRIAAYARKVRAAIEAEPALFFARSFDCDPWSTAKLVLSWRDALVDGGWTGGGFDLPRLDALVAVEAAPGRLPPGTGERFHAVCAELQRRPALGIESILLVDRVENFPPILTRLIEQLTACGAEIEEDRIDAAAAPDTDLGKVQRFLLAGDQHTLTGDGSFVLIDAETSLLAADAVAEWLAADDRPERLGTVILAEAGDTAMLDNALIGRGLPALGLSTASPWRGALQVLPLAFAIAWAPFDPKPLLDLLLLPRSPIPRFAAGKLIRALIREPGTGAEAHDLAWQDIETWAAGGDPPPDPQQVADRVARWRGWVAGGTHPRSDGMPLATVHEIGGRVSAWAIEMDRGEEDPLLLAVASAASVLSEAVELVGRDPLPSLLLERMINDVLADGARNERHVAQAGRLRCVRSAGALWREAEELIWWEFAGGASAAAPLPWDRAEQDTIARSAIRLENPARRAAAVAQSQARAICRASARVLLVCPERIAHVEAISHPLAHQLEPMLRDNRQLVTQSAGLLLDRAEPALAGRTLYRAAVCPADSPHGRGHWRLPDAAVARLAARRESATSFERMIDCQMRWIFEDVLRLRRGRFAELPGGSQLLGNLAHAVARTVFTPGPMAPAESLDSAITAAFDRHLPAIAAALQLPHHAGELAQARQRVPAAISHLSRFLRAGGFEVVEAEAERSADLPTGLALTGQLDLVVRHPVHGLGVIDLKWTGSPDYRRKELAEGRSIQLATYGALAEPGEPGETPGGYYLLSQRRLLAPEGSFLAEEGVVVTRSLPETWASVQESWSLWRDTAQAGDGFASGVGDDTVLMPIAPLTGADQPCRFCGMTGLCRIGVQCA
jgi:ATP-dependent helicase/nuclease subunit B